MKKTLDDKIEEKKKSLEEISGVYERTLKLYEIITENYKQLYDVNKGQVDSTHINGISNLLRRINDLIETKNKIQTEINNLLELAEADENREKEEKKETSIDSEGGIRGDKESILNLIDGGKIKESK